MLLKANSDKLIVGYDLGRTYSQISYCKMEDQKVVTLSSVAGEESYNIPTILCKRSHTNQWFYGREAQRCAQEKKGVLIENLLDLAVDGECVQIEGTSYDPVTLLTMFLKKSLSLFCVVAPIDQISAFLLTVEALDHCRMKVLASAVEGLDLKAEKIAFQSHAESFYSYLLYQPRELWSFQSLVCDYERDRIRVYHLKQNQRTEPVTVSIDTTEYPFLEWKLFKEKEGWKEEADRTFLEIASQICGENLISAVYLIGEAYGEGWMKESLRYLCRGRRVFQGSNLYSKGACFGMLERLNPSLAGREYVYLGHDKLKANIGIKVRQQGVEAYLALAEAGNNWYEVNTYTECYLLEHNSLELIITPLMGREENVVRMTLDGLQGIPVRLKLHVYLPEENLLKIEAQDLGFGEFRPASHYIWNEEWELY